MARATQSSSADIGDLFPQWDRSASGHVGPQRGTILLIGHNPNLLSSRAVVLKTAGFSVDWQPPSQAIPMLQDGANYEVVVFSHSLQQHELVNLKRILRERKPDTKLLLLLGSEPRVLSVDECDFDATLRGLDGPVAFIHAVRKLTVKTVKVE